MSIELKKRESYPNISPAFNWFLNYILPISVK
jgi:hypothetical protein